MVRAQVELQHGADQVKEKKEAVKDRKVQDQKDRADSKAPVDMAKHSA